MSKLEHTDPKQIASIVAKLRNGFESNVTLELEYRKQQLRNLKRCLLENRAQWTEGLKNDLRMDQLLILSEIDFTASEIDNALSNITTWAKPETRFIPMTMAPGKAYIIREPLGVVLMISPWNYPLSLLLKPLVGAIAAGNAVVLKPSEVSYHTAANLAELIPKYLDPSLFAVISGGVEETTEVLKQRFDHIMYTGNGTVAKIVARAAAEFLTPTTLELGGKSPVILDDTIDVTTAAKRLVWGKFLNCGQTCVAPDYILAKRNIYDKFMAEAVKQIKGFYGADTKNSKDYGKIINSRHVQRIASLLDGQKQNVYFGGDSDADAHYHQPTIVANPNLDSKLMQEEIFGPILPVIPYDDLKSVLKIIKERSKPLALYVFSNDNKTREFVLKNTSSGGGGINETVNHVICRDLPFGGVGESGLGSYNGLQTFLLFSHQRSILQRSSLPDVGIRFPPYNPFNLSIVKLVHSMNQPNISIGFLIGLVLLFVVYLQIDRVRGLFLAQ